MKNDETGMTLMEAIVALSLLSLICVVLLPIYMLFIDEQKTISQERRALYLVEKEALLLQQNASAKESGEQQEEIYTWDMKNNDNGIDLCISWEGDNNRSYEKCLFVLPETKGNDTY